MISSKRHSEIVRSIERQHEREMQRARDERDQLLDKVLYLAGKPWNLPPDLEPEGPAVEMPDIESAADQIFEEDFA